MFYCQCIKYGERPAALPLDSRSSLPGSRSGGLLGLGAGSPRAQVGVDNLPCSTRTTAAACLAECANSNFYFDCTCLFDDGLGDPFNHSCPDGKTCCWEMPCEKWSDVGELQCVNTDRTSDAGGGDVPPGRIQANGSTSRKPGTRVKPRSWVQSSDAPCSKTVSAT